MGRISNKRHRKKKRGGRKAWKLVLYSVAIILSLFGLLVLLVYIGLFGKLDTRNDLENFRNAEASKVLAEGGELIGKFFTENRTAITHRQIPSQLENALIATEDARFYDHNGVDTKSLGRVLVKSILFMDRSSGGGSTITQQLAKNMFGRKSFGPLTVPVNKIKEITLALRIEKVLTKEEILTLYLNTVSFSENIYGIGTASQRFFNKATEDLNIQESAVLIGMLKANTRYNPRLNPENAVGRRNVVIRQMEKYGYLTTMEADSICELKLGLNYTNIESEGPADYFLVQVKNEAERILDEINISTGKNWDIEKDGLTLTTTLDFNLQKYASGSLRNHLPGMQKRLDSQYRSSAGRKTIGEITARETDRLGLNGRAGEITVQQVFDWEGSYTDTLTVTDSLKHSLTLLHAGLLAIDPNSGAIRIWVGGIDFRTHPYDQVLARRQLASVFKPVLYAAALEEGMEPCDYLDNDSIVLSDFQDYSPENFDHSYGGKYSLAGALAQSMNVPTFSLFLKIGYPRLDSMWKDLGFSFPLDNTPSLALGTAEASVKEIAAAYSVFANGGTRIEPWSVISIKDRSGNLIWENNGPAISIEVISRRSAMLMSAMLQKAIREGTGSSMISTYGVSLPLAGKTGTSQNYADAWFAAFNPGLTIVARVGASTPMIHFNSGSYGSGSTLALPLVALTLAKAQQNREIRNKYFSEFQELPPDLAGLLDCPDFRDENFFDRVKDLLEKDRTDYTRRTQRQGRDLKSILRRIFKR